MTIFGHLIKGLCNMKNENGTRVFPYPRNEIARQLMKAAGVTKLKEANTYGKWIDLKTPNNIASYFPEGNVNIKGVISFFKHHIRDNPQIVQEKYFSRTEDLIDDSIINNPDMFYKRLLNRFLDSLGLVLLENFSTEITPIDKAAFSLAISSFDNNKGKIHSKKEMPFKNMSRMLKIAIDECDIWGFMMMPPICSIKTTIYNNIDNFNEAIKNNILEHVATSERNEIIYQNIIDFMEVLNAYASYLKNNTKQYPGSTTLLKYESNSNMSHQNLCYEYRIPLKMIKDIPSEDTEREIEHRKKSNEYRQQIDSLYSTIFNEETLLIFDNM